MQPRPPLSVVHPTTEGFVQSISPRYRKNEANNRMNAFNTLNKLGLTVVTTLQDDKGYLFEYQDNRSEEGGDSRPLLVILKENGFTPRVLHGRPVAFLAYSSPSLFLLVEKFRESYLRLLYALFALVLLFLSGWLFGKMHKWF